MESALSQDGHIIMKHATILAGGLLDCKSVYGESISWYMPLRPEDLPITPTEQGPHEIEIDVLCLVSANHNLTMQAIAEDEERPRERWENGHVVIHAYVLWHLVRVLFFHGCK